MKPLALAGVMCCLSSLANTTFYVAPDGNDTWTGRLPQPNAAKSDGPLASLEGARDAVRALKAAGELAEAVTVEVRGGTYALNRTLVFTAEDSGVEGRPVTYRAHPGESVVLTGGRPVTGWKKHEGGVWVAELAAQGFDDFRFRELFFRGERQVLARYPNYDPEHPVTGGLLYVDDTAAQSHNSFYYREGTIPFDKWGPIPQAEVNIFPYHCWDHNILRIAKVDQELNLITLRYRVAGSIFVGNRYFIQNLLGALDAPGEWYCDWATGRLYFYPPEGGALSDGDVVVPVLENLVEFSGTTETPVEHITFHGFRLQVARQDAIILEGARNCAVTGNTVTQVGGVGVNVGYLRNALKGVGLPWRKAGATRVNVHSGDRSLIFSYFSNQCRVAGNDIFSTGGDGLVLGGSENTADNNHIHSTGLYDRVCAGLTICGNENVASHNVIHDVPRDGIFINGKLNTAEYNEIRNSMLYTADNSAIALRQHDVNQAVRNRGNVLRYNRILDVVGYGSYPHCQHPGKGFASPFCSFGIYLDGSICGVTVYGNIIARCGGTSVFVQFGGDNAVENNIFVEGDAKRVQFDSMVFFGTFMYSDREGKYKEQEPPNRFRHNIFYYGGPDTKLYQVGHWDNAPTWDRRQAVFEDNLFWHKGQPIALCMHKTMDYKSLEEWQAQGYDTRSIVADPLFVDLAKDDYRLRPDSPAYKVGFQDINSEIEKIGAYRSEERASWPLQNAVLEREQPVVFDFPETPVALVEGFELAPMGSTPARSRVSTEGVASVLICNEAASSGRHSLRFTDAPGLKDLWKPHVFYNPSYKSGKLHFSIDFMNSAEAPADFYMEFRDWAQELLVGPTFRVTREGAFFVNGRLGAGGREIARVPVGEWCRVTIDFAVGEDAPREYTLKLSVPEQEDVVATLPFCDAAFQNLTWFGISSISDERTVFYVDNLILGPPDSEKIAGAAASRALQGIDRPQPKVKIEVTDPDRIVGHWEFEDEGFELADSSGNGLTGEWGGVPRARGDFGGALYLDGSGAAATISDSPLLQFGTDDLTFECWLYPLDLQVASQHQRRRIIEKGAYPATWWNVDVWADGRVQMEMADENAANGTTVSAGSIPEKAWTHVAIVVDRRNRQVRYYFNGKPDSTVALPASFAGALNVSGRPLSTGTWQQFVGLLADLKIYRRALGADEIARSYEGAKERYVSGEFQIILDE